MERELAEFSDPRLVAIYETVCFYEPGTQPDFYAHIATEIGAKTILDIGCGTGLISRKLAHEGFHVIGIDPASAMISAARSIPNSNNVKWICGTTAAIPECNADLAVMSGHVAQFFLSDESWQQALEDIAGALRPGGYLAFETRNPAAREWQNWTEKNRSTVTGAIDTWTTLESIDGDVVTSTVHDKFPAGVELTSITKLRFRQFDQLTTSLQNAGFIIEKSYGNWSLQPIDDDSPEFIIVAKLGVIPDSDPVIPDSDPVIPDSDPGSNF